jgi:hypothetical protein
MALAEALVEAYFTATRPLSIGLARRGVELADGGYSRSRVAGDWNISGASVVARGLFGPFVGTVAFDEALLFDGDRLVETVAVDGPVALPPGASWTQELILAVAGL